MKSSPESARRDDRTAPAEDKVSLGVASLRLLRDPRTYLLQRWNWKSAVMSSAFRAVLFFCVNLTAGFPAARAAFLTELVFRGITSGFYGALTEAFREVEPAWEGALAVMLLLPIANHSLEFVVHWMRGTVKIGPSIIASVIFTAFSSLFNWYAMRRGALIVGAGKGSLWGDLARMPKLVMDFLKAVPRLMAPRPTQGANSSPALPDSSV
jgi:hypothetical protein